MTLFDDPILQQARALAEMISALPLDEQVQKLNAVRELLHEVSPFRDHPVDLVVWVEPDRVQANAYNPNKVARPEMVLLERSIEADGFTQPIVGFPEDGGFEVVDGYHRSQVGQTSKRVLQSTHGYLPVTRIRSGQQGLSDRMAATIRHNRARGEHGIVPMMEIVAQALQLGWSDDQVAREFGMDADEVLRFKQQKGLKELFKGLDYSPSWE
ncbi:IbrB-like domain-containing protein [Deinococcus misasensis]|uniref:IbrB-like domain-containing protein n=1 Tax=Deinococcus misasensis TaxID=392413 RepID=UPI00054FEB3F|nr:ParB/RepB/Spo0J family partition protein [Deinococcus misasensis]